MKRVLLMVLSVVLVLACIFGMFACVAGLQDIMNINEYKNADAAFARENLVTARDGIAQLKENEETYLTGVGTYTSGLSDYYAGQQTLAAGEATLAQGYKDYEAGKQTLAEGQATIDANTQAYNEGKETLAKIEPLLPYLNQYVEFRDGYLAQLPGFSNAQAWFVSVVRPLGAQLGLEIPEDVTDFPAYINQMVADGKAQLKQYEDGLAALEAGKAQLADAEKQLADGEATLAQGRKDLAAGAAQLADGKAQLSVFEEGELTLAAGGMALFEGMPPCYSYFTGRQTVKSLPEYLAAEFGLDVPDNLVVIEEGKAVLNEEAYADFCDYVLENMYKVDEDGNVVEKNGHAMLDLDKCSVLCDMAEQYLVDQEADIKAEVYVRIGLYAALAVACVLGIIAGIRGLVAGIKGTRKTGVVLGIITAAMGVVTLIVGACTHFTDYIYTVRLDEAGAYVGETSSALDFTPIQQYSGSLQLAAIIAVAAAAVLFVVFAVIAANAAKQKTAALAAAAEDDEEAAYAAAALAAAEAAAAAEEPKADEVVVEAAPEAAADEETVKE